MTWDEAREHALFWLATLVRDARGLFAQREAKSVPTDVNIEPTNLCNANCVFCGYQFQERPHTQMPVATGLAIIDAARRAGVTQLGLTPIVGDPLIHRNVEAFVRYAREGPAPLYVGLTTNGILLTLERYRALVAAGVQEIVISMTYPDETEYRRIYRSAKLKAVVGNIGHILDLPKAETCKMSIGVRTDRRGDWASHPLFVRARERGWSVDRNRFFDDWSGRTSEIAESEGLWTRPNRPKVVPCSMTYTGPHFMSDGRATACGCRDLDGGRELALSSDALLADMRAVYASGEVAALREAFRDGRAPPICQSCRHYNPAFAGEPAHRRVGQLLGDAAAAVKDLAAIVRAAASEKAGRAPEADPVRAEAVSEAALPE